MTEVKKCISLRQCCRCGRTCEAMSYLGFSEICCECFVGSGFDCGGCGKRTEHGPCPDCRGGACQDADCQLEDL